MKQYYVDNADKLKKNVKQYQVENADKIKQNMKQYYVDNADKLKQNVKQYQVENAEKLKQKNICICGTEYSTTNKARHLKSKKHINYTENLTKNNDKIQLN